MATFPGVSWYPRKGNQRKEHGLTGLSVFFEMCFLLCFAAAWPANIVKSWRSRTARGRSMVFPLIVEAGYIFGIISKFTAESLTYVVFFYFLNFTMVAIDLALTLRNRRLDAKRDREFMQVMDRA